MGEDLQVAGWRARGIPHGFARPGTEVAAGLVLSRVRQVHGVRILHAHEATVGATSRSEIDPAKEPGDGLLATQPGDAVAVATADCVPVLLTDESGSRVAAVHAGWRGTLGGIAGAAVDALCRTGADRRGIEAAIGPCIGACCFEVETEFREKFRKEFGALVDEIWKDGRPGHGTLDLRLLNRRQLEIAGIGTAAIHDCGGCTACGTDGFASWRRDGQRAGRQLSWIGVRA